MENTDQSQVSGPESRYMNPVTYAGDIPYELAQAAHSGTSWTPETRAASEVNGYAQFMIQTYKRLHAQAVRGGTLDKLDDQFAEFRARHQKHMRNYLHSRTGFVSAWIAGPSKYPAGRMQKRHNIIERRLEDLCAFRERAIRRINAALRPDLAPIRAGDANAIEALEEKIHRAERNQELMKLANKAIRKEARRGPQAQAFALAALGFTEDQTEKLLQVGTSWGQGFAHFNLSNNNANIRRLKGRVAQLTRLYSQESRSTETESGIRLEEAPNDNRVRLYYPGKPDEAQRIELKRNGFRWTPSLGCWQAYYNKLATARHFASQTAI